MAVKSDAEFLVLLTSTAIGQVGFTELEGGELERPVEDVPDSFKDETASVVGTAKYTQITLRVPYDPAVHDDFLSKAKAFCLNEGDDIQVSVQPVKTCPDQTPDGKARVYSGCIPSRIRFPGVKRGVSGAAIVEVVVHPKRMKFA